MIKGVPADEAWRFRPQLDHFAKRSLGRWRGDALEMDVRQGRRQLYVAAIEGEILGVAMTGLSPEAVHVDAVTGRHRALWIAELEAHMTEWAKATGRKRVIALARPGWAPEAKALGYREAHREFVREVA